MTPIRIRAEAAVLSVASRLVGGAGSTTSGAKGETVSARIASRRMADGNQWTTVTRNINVAPSFCDDDAESNRRRYGRSYTWKSAHGGALAPRRFALTD